MEHDYVTVTLCIVVALRMYRHFTPIEHLAPDTPPPENYLPLDQTLSITTLNPNRSQQE